MTSSSCRRRSAVGCYGPGVSAALALVLFATSGVHAEAATAAADIVQFAYEPTILQVPAGTTVTWTNHDSIIHSVTQGTPDAPGDTFDSGYFDQDTTFSFTFSDPGDYAYFCKRHTFMQGTIRVTAD